MNQANRSSGHRWISALTLSLLAVLVCFFQACGGCNSNVDFSPSQTAALQSGGGDGRPIESKPEPGTYYRFVPGLKCNDTLAYAGALVVSTSEVQYREVDQETCTEAIRSLSLSELQWSKLNPEFLGRKSGIYQKLTAPPQTDPDRVANQVPVAEAWCRLRTSQLAADVLMTEKRATRELKSSVVSSRLINGSWQMTPRQSHPVIRESRGLKVEYRFADVTLEVNRSAVTASGALQARLLGAIEGQSLDETVECRLSSEYDSQTPSVPYFAFNLGEGQLPSTLTLSRSGTATYFDPTGKIVVAAENMPRFDFNPSTREPLGLLLEEARSNMLRHSADLLNSVWISNGLAVTREGSLAGLDRYRIAANDPAATQIWGRAAQQVDIISSREYALSFFVQRGNQNSARVFVCYGPGSEAVVDFDLTAGTSQIANQNVISVRSVSIIPLAEGYRIGLVFSSSAAGRIDVGVGPRSNVVGDYIYATGAQLEMGSTISSYIPTSLQVVQRGSDSLILRDLAWFNPSRGTFLLAISQPQAAAGQAQSVFALNGLGSDNYGLSFVPGANYRAEMEVGAASQNWVAAGVLKPGSFTTQQLGLSYDSSGASLILNGVTAPAPSAVPLGISPLSANFGGSSGGVWSGHIRAFTYWSERLEDVSLSEKTR